ncbi:MAG: hypothetical protein JOZ90_06630 [Alphaproteobacteria bacterium]|nr:hypothetical protein [Alphaproteobacteria bacterium]MBV9370082.1 hypothetical protein [Alphaproteobacteria bacterium]MBV9900756.1 hypothetical protein [Alphaproteobacteria bacterium]
MQRIAQLRRVETPRPFPPPPPALRPAGIQSGAVFRRRGPWGGWEMFVRLLIFATRNNHR